MVRLAGVLFVFFSSLSFLLFILFLAQDLGFMAWEREGGTCVLIYGMVAGSRSIAGSGIAWYGIA